MVCKERTAWSLRVKELYKYVYSCIIYFIEVKCNVITIIQWNQSGIYLLSFQVSHDRRQHTMSKSQIKLIFTGYIYVKNKYK